jgi:hypothetical protein
VRTPDADLPGTWPPAKPLRYGAHNPLEEHTVTEPEHEADESHLDDEERAARAAKKERDHEQDDADDDVAPGPAPDQEATGLF